jgi:hypothetical protein
MVWNPFGRYVFAHNANVTTTGGGLNNLISGTGTLELSSLTSTSQFDLNLVPVVQAGGPTQQTYTIAVFLGGITGAGNVLGAPFANGTDISSLFTLSGSFLSHPATFATVQANPLGAGQVIQLTFTPSPEPSGILLVCGVVGGLGWWRARRGTRHG